MAKQKKNSNYVTEKTIAAKAQKEEELKKKEQSKKNTKIVIAVSIIVGTLLLLFAILLVGGVFDYAPEGTYDVTLSFNNGKSLHIELYGNDAPQTVAHFIEMCNKGKFDEKTAHTLIEGLLYIGDTKADGGSSGIKGEFKSNGVDNKIPMKKGTLCMARGEGKDSAYGQFFVLTERNNDLMGEYAAFGRITDYSQLDALIDSITVDANGNITNAPMIVNVNAHSHDDH